jgi:glycosyltransferase involved in cell wall biosynthesis
VKLTIIIPVYNEVRTISEVVDRVHAVDIGPI